MTDQNRQSASVQTSRRFSRLAKAVAAVALIAAIVGAVGVSQKNTSASAEMSSAPLVVTRVSNGSTHLYVESRAGQTIRRLTSGSASDGTPAVSPDGKTVAFGRTERNGAMEIMTVPITGGPPHLVIRKKGFDDPAWSPTGTSLFVLKEVDENEEDFAFYAVKLNPQSGKVLGSVELSHSSGEAPLHILKDGTVTYPAYTPGGANALASVALDGSNARGFINTINSHVYLNSTGRLAVFVTADQSGGDVSAFLTTPAGHHQRMLVRGNVQWASFSPDDKELALLVGEKIEIFNAQTGSLVRTLPAASGVFDW